MHHDATVLQLLERFNRKERFFLLGFALGNARFQLSDEFRIAVSRALRPCPGWSTRVVPRDALCWMDYHLDWVWASLVLHDAAPTKSQFPSPGWPRDVTKIKPGEPAELNVNANQEDIDLLVAFEDQEGTHLVFIEGKGETNWSVAQMESKGRRLGRMFGNGDRPKPSGRVNPYMLLASPRESAGLNAAKVPGWMKPKGKFAWVPLRIPPDRLQIVRTRPDHQLGWTLRTRPGKVLPDDALIDLDPEPE
jgi:hypothetical protein